MEQTSTTTSADSRGRAQSDASVSKKRHMTSITSPTRTQIPLPSSTMTSTGEAHSALHRLQSRKSTLAKQASHKGRDGNLSGKHRLRSNGRHGKAGNDVGWHGVHMLAKRAELYVERLFRKHGRRVARHPVQTLLVACLLITSLFYPAVGIFLWSSKGGPGVSRGDARSVWRSLSTPLLDSFASSGRKHHNSLRDLRMIWDETPDLRAMDARDFYAYSHSMAAARWIFGGQASDIHNSRGSGETDNDTSSSCTSLRIEHVFVSTEDVIMGMGHRFGALHVPVLRSALKLQEAIESILASNDQARPKGLPACIRSPEDGRCISLSPLAYWSHDAERLLSDQAPAQTVLASASNHTPQGVPLALSTTLAGRNHLFQHLPRADHLALTFFLEDSDGCRDALGPRTPGKVDEESESHRAWLTMLRDITGHSVALLSSDYRAPKETILQFSPVYPSSSFPTHHALLLAAYIGMIAWLTRHFVKMRNVHSKFGLAFTACVELVISMTLAISISALSGVRLTLLPWEILPFVIAVIGSENTFVLTNAIVSTPVTLTVSSRIATGLEKAGMTMAVTVLSDVILMALVCVFVDVQAVRDFCIFAIFALLVDFIMQVTFYATVLSIDLQRLDLADLLSLDRSAKIGISAEDEYDFGLKAGAESTGDASPTEMKALHRRKTDGDKPSFIKLSCRAAWRARTARTVSLSILLGFLFGIYIYHGSGYASKQVFNFSSAGQAHTATASRLPEDRPAGHAEPTFDPYSHLSSDSTHPKAVSARPWWLDSPSAKFWQALNPSDAAEINVKIEPWTVVSLTSASGRHLQRQGSFASWAIFRPRIRAMIWFLKLVILPIAGTTSLLWVLLLYLLKDTELLEAQQNKQNALDEDHDDHFSAKNAKVSSSSSSYLDATVFVEASTHSADVLLLAADGRFTVSISLDWTMHAWRLSRTGTRSIQISLSEALGPSFSPPSALSLCTADGLVAVGHLNGGLSLLSLPLLCLVKSSLHCDPCEQVIPSSKVQHIFCAPSEKTTIPESGLVTIHRDGSMWRWDYREVRCIQLAPAAERVPRAVLAMECNHKGMERFAAITSWDEQLCIHRIDLEMGDASRLTTIYCAGMVIRAVAVSDPVGLSNESRLRIAAVGTGHGQILIYDTESALKLGQISIPEGTLQRLFFVQDLSRQKTSDRIYYLVAITSTRTLICEVVVQRQRAGSNQFRGGDSAPFERQAVLNNSGHRGDEGPLGEGPPLVIKSRTSADRQLPVGAGGDAGTMQEDTENKRECVIRILVGVDCPFGSAALVYSNGKPRLLGIRRKSEAQLGLAISTSEETPHQRMRWELFELSLSPSGMEEWSRSHRVDRGHQSQRVGHLDDVQARSAVEMGLLSLPLEHASSSRFPLRGNAVEMGRFSSALRDVSPRHHLHPRASLQPSSKLLSFTNITHLHAVRNMPPSLHLDKDSVDMLAMSNDTPAAATQEGLVFVFGNSLCVIALRPH